MTTRTDPDRPWRLLAVAGLGALALKILAAVIVNSGDPGHYYRYRNDATGFEYPTEPVFLWCQVIIGEAIAAAVCVWETTRLAAACVLLAIAMAGVGFAFGIISMHAPPYFGAHVGFLVLAAGWLFALAVLIGLARFVQWARRSPPP